MEDIKGYEVARLQDPSPLQLVETIDSAERANIDIQVSTARAYPRNLSRCINNSIATATMDRETAQTCGYALPRGGKPITGPSVHLAKLIVAQYGNMRIDARVIAINEREVVSRGMAWDLESNNAYAVEVRRSIIGKNGRFSDDMITVTGNAANAIALRNAVFAVIPGAIVDKVYRAAQQTITGDLSDENKLIQSREKAIIGASTTNFTTCSENLSFSNILNMFSMVFGKSKCLHPQNYKKTLRMHIYLVNSNKNFVTLIKFYS